MDQCTYERTNKLKEINPGKRNDNNAYKNNYIGEEIRIRGRMKK
jgi:hypothetical protein